MPQDWTNYRKIKDKLFIIGTEKAHERYKILLNQSRCPRCGYFLDKWGSKYFFAEDKKPKFCHRCHYRNPLKNVVDPLNEMLKKLG